MSKGNAAEKKVIAITFDDGPSMDITPKVLQVLKEQGIPGTFFVLGNHITADSAGIMLRAEEIGCEICNHSKTHTAFTELTPEQMNEELIYTSDLVQQYTGKRPRFFRPPYIALNDTVMETVELPMICGYGCQDWLEEITAEMRARMILDQARDGAIILLHDAAGNEKTVEALKIFLPILREQGYEFLTVSQLFAEKGLKWADCRHKIYTCLPEAGL